MTDAQEKILEALNRALGEDGADRILAAFNIVVATGSPDVAGIHPLQAEAYRVVESIFELTARIVDTGKVSLPSARLH